MKKPFSVGDRVRVYGLCNVYGGPNQLFYDERLELKAVVRKIQDNGRLIVSVGPETVTFEVHPKQCRRLVKKKKKWEWRYLAIITAEGNQLLGDTLLKQDEVLFARQVAGYTRIKVYLK